MDPFGAPKVRAFACRALQLKNWTDRAVLAIPAQMLTLKRHVTRLFSLSGDQQGNLARAMFLFAVQQCHAGQTVALVVTERPHSVYLRNLVMYHATWWQAVGPRNGKGTGAGIVASDT